MNKKVKRELFKIQEIKREVELKLQDIVNNFEIPEGRLSCSTCNGSYQFYLDRKYVKKDKQDGIKSKVEVEYYKKLLQQLGSAEKHLQHVYQIYNDRKLERLYTNLHPGKQALIDPIIRPIQDLIREFEEEIYEGKDFDESNITEYFTMKNERVRSKAEIIIANELYQNGIPYKYERSLELEKNGQRITFYPDFTAMNTRTGDKWIIEHFGMMDDMGYHNSAFDKLNIYEKNGYLVGKNLIIFHETSQIPLNTMTVRDYIREFLL
ncbi:MAG: hypothetical protein K6G63_02395 [Eubacterium sp.]|nr:hypothetical protein [Eubacterium sp.]